MKQQHLNMIAGGSLLAVLLGVALGYYAAEIMAALSFLGQIYLAALRLVVVPLIISAIVVGISTIGDGRKSVRVIGKTAGYIVGSTALAVIIGLVVAYLFNPSSPELQAHGGPMPEGMVTMIPSTLGGLLSALISPNLFALFSQGRFLGLILFVLALSVALLGLRGYSSRNNLFQFFRTLQQACLTVIQWLLYVTPFGILFLVGSAVAVNNAKLLQLWSGLGVFTLAIIVALLVHAVIALPLILRYLGDQPIMGFLRDLGPGLTSGFATASSMTSMPLIYDGVSEQSDVDHRASAAMLPLGHTVNMHGTAIYAVVAAVFVANVYAVDISFMTWVLIGLGALFIAIGTPGIPGAAALSLAVIFNLAGFPTEAYAGLGLMFAVDWLFDRLRTPVNLWGNAVGAAVIGNTFEFKTAGSKSRAEGDRDDRGRAPRDSRSGGRDRQDRRGSDRSRGRDDRRGSDRRPSGGRDDRRDDRRGPSRGRGRDRQEGQRPPDRSSGGDSRQRTSDRSSDIQPVKQDSASPFAVSASSQPALGPTDLDRSEKVNPRDEVMQRGRGRRPGDQSERSDRSRGRSDREDRPQRGDRRRTSDRQRGRGRDSDDSRNERDQQSSDTPSTSDAALLNRASVAAQLVDSQSRRSQQMREESGPAEVDEPRTPTPEPKAASSETRVEKREQPAESKPVTEQAAAEDGGVQRENDRQTAETKPDEETFTARRTLERPATKPEPRPVDKPEKPQEEPETSSDDDQPLSFGRRGRSRRTTSKPTSGDQPGPGKPASVEVEEQPTEFDKGEMEFGRGKRRQKKG